MNRKRLKRLLLIQKYLTFCIEWELGFEKDTKMEEERMLKWFAFGHLPEHLQGVSSKFYDVACALVAMVESGPERTVALRKLLEAKDAAVRAKLNPGG